MGDHDVEPGVLPVTVVPQPPFPVAAKALNFAEFALTVPGTGVVREESVVWAKEVELGLAEDFEGEAATLKILAEVDRGVTAVAEVGGVMDFLLNSLGGGMGTRSESGRVILCKEIVGVDV